IDVPFCGMGQNARRNVDRRADPRDPAGIFDLQTVKRILPVAHTANAQKPVGVTDNVGKRRHDADSAVTLTRLQCEAKQISHASAFECDASPHRFRNARAFSKHAAMIRTAYASELAARSATSLCASRHLHDYSGNIASSAALQFQRKT